MRACLQAIAWTMLAGIVPYPAAALAGADAESWLFDVTTGGEDVQWTSPTSVNPAAALYVSGYAISLVEVDVTWFGIPFNNVDVIGSLPPELLGGQAAVPGPAPLVVSSQPIVYPDPPAPTCLGAQLTIALNAEGFGQVLATDVVLGTCDVDIGFGVVTVELQSARVVGTVDVAALTCPWDLDGDGRVATTDLLELLGQWAASPIGPPDLDGDGLVGTTDFLALLAHWGACP